MNIPQPITVAFVARVVAGVVMAFAFIAVMAAATAESLTRKPEDRRG